MTSRVPPPSPSGRYDAALRFLAGRIDYERALSMPASEEAMKLDRMRELLTKLGNPQQGIPIVHIAGTKGKGSTSAMIAAMLTAAGYRIGLFTSPHLERVEERIAVDGRPCPPEEFADLIERVRPAVEAMDARGTEEDVATDPATRKVLDRQPPPSPSSPTSSNPSPTYFEILTAMAFVHLRRRRVDAAVLEVGLGGRLDSTNVCSPAVTIITSISFDHTKQLGDTLAAIAAEKAGIIKRGVPVISGVEAEEPRDVIRAVARERGCRLMELGVDFFAVNYRPPRHLEQAPSPAQFDFRRSAGANSRELIAPGNPSNHKLTAPGESADTHRGLLASGYPSLCNVELGLLGRHQAANAAVALAAVEELRRSGWDIPEAAVRRGLAEIAWPARVEVFARRPTVVLDAAHNVASIKALLDVLDGSFSANRRWLIFATTQEKDLRGMLAQLLGRFDHVIFTRYSNNPRSVPPEELLATAKELVCPLPLEDGPGVRATTVQMIATPAEAWKTVRRLAMSDDLICVAGSFFLASEMRAHIVEKPLTAIE